MPLATIKVLPISERCGWPTAIEIVAINQRQKAPATPLYRGKYSRFSKVRQWACQKNFSLLLRRRITKKTRRIPNPSCFFIANIGILYWFWDGTEKSSHNKTHRKEDQSMHHGASLWLFLDGCSAKRQKAKTQWAAKESPKAISVFRQNRPALGQRAAVFCYRDKHQPFCFAFHHKKDHRPQESPQSWLTLFPWTRQEQT